jgi:molybdopterin-guanine dinucleotide biosynthesis protein A
MSRTPAFCSGCGERVVHCRCRDLTQAAIHRLNKAVKAADDDGEPLHTLTHNGCHLVLKEALSQGEETTLWAFIEGCRAQCISPAKMMAAIKSKGNES